MFSMPGIVVMMFKDSSCQGGMVDAWGNGSGQCPDAWSQFLTGDSGPASDTQQPFRLPPTQPTGQPTCGANFMGPPIYYMGDIKNDYKKL